MHLEHKPGEILQVDWAGNKAYYLDPYTGNKTTAYLFLQHCPTAVIRTLRLYMT